MGLAFSSRGNWSEALGGASDAGEDGDAVEVVVDSFKNMLLINEELPPSNEGFDSQVVWLRSMQLPVTPIRVDKANTKLA